MAFSIEVEQLADTLILRPVGDLDLGNRHALFGRLANTINDDTVNTVVVDLATVPFADATGLCELLECRKLALAVGATFQLAHISARVRRVIDLAGLGDAFGMEDS